MMNLGAGSKILLLKVSKPFVFSIHTAPGIRYMVGARACRASPSQVFFCYKSFLSPYGWTESGHERLLRLGQARARAGSAAEARLRLSLAPTSRGRRRRRPRTAVTRTCQDNGYFQSSSRGAGVVLVSDFLKKLFSVFYSEMKGV